MILRLVEMIFDILCRDVLKIKYFSLSFYLLLVAILILLLFPSTSSLPWSSILCPQTGCHWCFPCSCHSCETCGPISRDQHRPDQLLPHQEGERVGGCLHAAEHQRGPRLRASQHGGWCFPVLLWWFDGREHQEQFCAGVRTPRWWGRRWKIDPLCLWLQSHCKPDLHFMFTCVPSYH